MKRVSKLLILISLSLPVLAQVPVAPIVQPHVTFVNASGEPCSACSLYSYAAGTTTPQPTYTDSSGTSQNTNPIILDPAGGAQIWLGTSSYKLILQDSNGTTIWTVNNVNGSTSLPCATVGAIQIANNTASALTCDPTITINAVNHTINVGTLPANHVTIGAVSTPTAWTFDTTSPATALASLGALGDGAGTTTPNQLALSTSSAHVIGYSSSIPAGITAITASPSDNSTKPATTAYVATPGAINPTSVQVASGTAITDNQGNGAKVQHSTGSTTNGDAAIFDSNGNAIDSGSPPALVTTPRTCPSGCYRINGDGTIEEWGTVTVGPSGNSYNTATITFPHAFTTQAVLTGNTVGEASFSGDPTTPPCVQVQSASLTGGTFFMARCIIASAGGGNFDNSLTLNWHAIGY